MAFTGDFRIFGDKATFDRLSGGGTAVIDATRAADGDVLVAWMFGQRMNGLPKYVVSSTLTDATWNNSTILRGDPVQEAARLKEDVGEILVAGSQRLVSTLHAAGLIDEYRLMVFPIVIGGGRSLFDGAGMPVSLRLAEAATAADTLLLRYVRA